MTPPPHRSRPRPAPATGIWLTWPPVRIVALTVLLVAGDFLLQIIFYALGGGLFVPVLIGTVGGVFLPLYLLIGRARLPARDDFSLHWPPPAALLAAALMAVAALAPTSLLAQLSLHLHPADPQWLTFMADAMPTSIGGIALAFFTVVLAAPLAEELVFRGLLHRLASYLWGAWPAAVVSSLVFGIVHGEPWYLFGLIGIGFVLAVVYEATGSVLACWVTHVVHNGISLGMMLWGDQSSGAPAPLTLVDWLVAGGSLLLLVLLALYLLQNRPRRRSAAGPGPG